MGVFPVNGGEGPHGQFPVDSDNDNQVRARRARAVHDQGIAGKASPAMPSPSTVTKNVDAGRLMKCLSRLRLVMGETTVNIEKVCRISHQSNHRFADGIRKVTMNTKEAYARGGAWRNSHPSGRPYVCAYSGPS